MLTIIDFLLSDIQTSLHLNKTKTNAFAKLNIKIIRDLLFYKPSYYHTKIINPNLSNLQHDQYIQTNIIITHIKYPTKYNSPFIFQCENSSGSISLTIFNYPTFFLKKLSVGTKHMISGKVQIYNYYPQIIHLEFITNPILHPAIYPIYKLTSCLTNNDIYTYIFQIYEKLVQILKFENNEYFNYLMPFLKSIHSIEDNENLKIAWQNKKISLMSLIKEEFIANQLVLCNLSNANEKNKGNKFKFTNELHSKILKNLNFILTDDQIKVINEIKKSQEKNFPMMRLLQGDVGSGKTLVALLTMINVVESGYQTVLMAPTEILAIQHYEFFQNNLNFLNINIALLTGNISMKERKILLTNLENGTIQILIGTHALFQENVNFNKLGYVVIDEQHRFGVEQRLALINKATHPDVLVMSATPIPRCLTLTLFGDMLVSKITQKPKNMLPIITTIMPNNKPDLLIEAIRRRLKLGEKIYWICSLIEDNNKIVKNLTSIKNRFDYISKIFPNITCFVHGKMKSQEKENIMNEFKLGKLKILVATSIIEVGVDVPDATIMIIENAEQFGLAQLHQMRGRVGRSNLQSYCILMYNSNYVTEDAIKRFKILRESNDGFYIAEQDLLLRGAGELTGTKQSGDSSFHFSDILEHSDVILEAREIAKQIIKDSNKEHINYRISLFKNYQHLDQ